MSAKAIFISIIAVGLLATVGWLLLRAGDRRDRVTDLEQTQPTTVSSGYVELSPAKLEQARIKTEKPTRQDMVITRSLPARFSYDDRRHVALRVSSDAVLQDVLVKPGDVVRAGQEIATLRSPSIGQARSEVLTCMQELEIAQRESEWHSKLCAGVQQIASQIRSGKSISEIELNSESLLLGNYRQQLISSYSQYILAQQLASAGRQSSGAISGVVSQQRESELQQARASLEGAVEEALFEAEQECRRADVQADAARRKLQLARQRMVSLLGLSGVQDSQLPATVDDLSLLSVLAPIDGTVEQRYFSPSERVAAGSELFVIADTSRLWVKADIRDRAWQAVNLEEGDQVTIHVPAQPQPELKGNVFFVGREIDIDSGAIPLVIEVDNREQIYRPGMFARVEVPVERLSNAIVVPQSAIVDIGGRSSVFVSDPPGYRAVEINPLATSGSLVAIGSELDTDQEVVVEGAFVLKSELLLESEE